MPTIAVIAPHRDGEKRVAGAVPDDHASVVRLWRDEYTRIDPSKIVDDVVDAGATIACIGPGLAMDGALSLAETFDRERPEICVILVAEPSATQWQDALRAGVRDVVSPAADQVELASVIARALQTAAGRQRAAVPEARDEQPSSRTVAVLSPKGGSGKTTIATNLGAGLARRPGASVAIVDLDLQFGDVAPYLQLLPEASIVDAARAPEALDATMLKVFLTRHPSGLYALCGPESPADADDVGFDHALQAVQLLSGEFTTVLVDTAGDLGEATLAAIEAATDLLFVCSTDVSAIRSLRKELDALDRLAMTGQRRHLVLNRSDAPVGVRVADVEDVLGLPVAVQVPSSKSVPMAVNQGLPVVEAYPRSPVARQLERLVDLFAGVPAPSVARADREQRRRRGRS
jgi:pilus assembly protein CpaE